MHPKLSIRTKLILSFMGFSSGLILLLYLFVVNWYFNNQVERIDGLLNDEAMGISIALTAFISHGNIDVLNNHKPLENPDLSRFLTTLLVQRLDQPRAYQTTLLITDKEKNIVSVSNLALNLNPDFLLSPLARIYDKKTLENKTELFSVQFKELNYRILEAPLEVNGITAGTIHLACLLDPIVNSSFDFILLSLLFLFTCIIINGVGGLVLVTRILSPVRNMSAAMNRVTESSLGTRLELLPGKDELSDLALTFNHALNRIEKAYRSQEQLVSDLSHQLRTPLTSMRGAVELGMKKAHSSADYQALLENCVADIDRITSLVNTLLTFARLDGHIESMVFIPCRLPKLIADTIEELSPLWEEKSISFDFCLRYYEKHHIEEFQVKNEISSIIPDAISDLFIIDADEIRFKQALINILDNAHKYTPIGGRISIELYREVTGDARICRIVIMNSGSSIPTFALQNLFTPFYQAAVINDKAITPNIENSRGFGLGLSICRRIVAMHQGKIRAFNPVSGGAAFEIILPITQSDRIVYDLPEPFDVNAPYDGSH